MLHEAAVSIWSVIGWKCEPVADRGSYTKYLHPLLLWGFERVALLVIIICIHHVVGGFVFTKLQVMHIFPSSTAAPVTECLTGRRD